ncbi:histidine-containing phosphotransfer protein 2-like [Zea mays]|uniref:histidine-containing phosphotransfer protein 2-like n=1 Tax=Zea mays TaxID=4577 RepID=UPI0004DEC0E3|nr:histidine-containing phosphotransfer protein 2-like [Zea mays]|eukprot:XP_008665852.1 histidine-containing phosphotransfer protein 2-like [Zea mays]
MAVAKLREQLNALLSSMITSFQQLKMLYEDRGMPGFIANVVTLFCDWIISDLASLLEHLIMDFDKVDPYVHQLKGSSAR